MNWMCSERTSFAKNSLKLSIVNGEELAGVWTPFSGSGITLLELIVSGVCNTWNIYIERVKERV